MSIFAVFDGHGGVESSQFLAENIQLKIESFLMNKAIKDNIPAVMNASFESLEREIMEHVKDNSGRY
jgi:serine/threonine protein phosphatase PrpC